MERGDHRVLLTFKKLVLIAGYEARAFARAFGLTPARIDVLLALQFGPVVQRDLAMDMAVTPPVVSRMLGALEELGLVERREMPEDRRQRLVELTDRGKARLETMFDGLFVDDGTQTLQWGVEAWLVELHEAAMKKAGVPMRGPPNIHNRELIWDMLVKARTTPPLIMSAMA